MLETVYAEVKFIYLNRHGRSIVSELCYANPVFEHYYTGGQEILTFSGDECSFEIGALLGCLITIF